MTYLRHCSWLIIMISWVSMSGQVDSFALATKMAQEERYLSAIEVYEDMAKRGDKGLALYYNLGHSYAKVDRYPEAVWAYEKALTYSDDEKALEDLNEVRGRLDNIIPEFSEFFLFRWWKTINSFLPSYVWVIFAMLDFAILLYLLYLSWFRNRDGLKGMMWVMGTGCVLFFTLSLTSVRLEQSLQHAIVIEDSAIHEGSDERSDEIRSVGEGNKVRLLDEIGGWVKVELPDKEVGWMDESTVRRL